MIKSMEKNMLKPFYEMDLQLRTIANNFRLYKNKYLFFIALVNICNHKMTFYLICRIFHE